jgi:hypothetical protein
MEIRLAGLLWRLTFEDRDAADACAARYQPWAIPSDVRVLRTIDLVVGAASFVPPVLPAGEEPSEVRVQRAGETFHLRRLDIDGSLDLEAGRGRLLFAGTPGALQSFLRVACALVLAPLGGVLVHASSIVRRERAFLFVGVSGAGKTTIARLSAPSRALSDEVSAVIPIGDGAYACHATPFWGDLADDRDDAGRDEEGRPVPLREGPAASPLARILFPVQDTQDCVVPVGEGRAFATVLREAFSFGDDEPTMRAITASCGEIVSRVPAGELHFRKTPAFWTCIEEWVSRPIPSSP